MNDADSDAVSVQSHGACQCSEDGIYDFGGGGPRVRRTSHHHRAQKDLHSGFTSGKISTWFIDTLHMILTQVCGFSLCGLARRALRAFRSSSSGETSSIENIKCH